MTAKLLLDHADWITPTADALWISSETNSVYRLDPQTLQITASVPVGQNPLASTLLGDQLWVPNIDSNAVPSSIRPRRGDRRRSRSARAPLAVVQEAGDLWVTSEGDGDVLATSAPQQIDVRQQEANGQQRERRQPRDVEVDGERHRRAE